MIKYRAGDAEIVREQKRRDGGRKKKEREK
jgi:hypothetical protein